MAKKDTYWFPHDFNAHNDPKLIALVAKYGMAGYGMWWMFVEILRAEIGYKYNIKNRFAYPSIAKGLMVSVQEAADFISDCINEFELLRTDDEYVWSQSLLDRMERWDRKKERLSENGRKGAAATNAKKKSDDTEKQSPVNTDPNREAKAAYKKLEKTKENINSFLLHQKPKFIEPYVDFWNIFARERNLPQVIALNKPRKEGFRVRVTEASFDFREILRKAATSDFLIKEFRMSFDWIITSPNNYLKVLEGNYDNKAADNPASNKDDRDDIESLTRKLGKQ